MKKLIVCLLFIFIVFFQGCVQWQKVLFIRVEDKYYYDFDYYNPYYCHEPEALCKYIKIRFDGDYLIFRYEPINENKTYEYRINVNTTDYVYGR